MRILQFHEGCIQLITLLDCSGVGDLDIGSEAVEFDAVLRQEGFVLLQALKQISFGYSLLPPPGGLRRYNPAVNPGPNAIGTGLVLVAADFTLLTEST